MQSLHAAESDQIQSLDEAVPVVAGVYVNRVESETIEVLRRGDEYWIPVPKLQELVGIRVEFSGQGIQIRTPIGNVTAPMEDSGLYQGEHYLSSGLLKDKTKIQLSFSPSLYAISLIVPWRPGAPLFGESPDKQAKSHPVADVLAPSGALSFLNIENNYLSTFGDSKDMWDYYVESGGRQGEGTWATRFQGDNTDEREHELDLYYWNRVYDRSVLRLGTNYANLNSLLSSQDYTGAQWAYSNTNIQEYTDFEGQTNLDQFIDDDKKLQRDISRGDGPPAGIAELRIDDVPQARVRISLDGQYTFRDVPQVANDFQQVQIYVYRYSLADAPVQILDYTKTTLGRPLEQGEMLLRAGIGETGNPLSDNEEPDDGHFAGFVGARYGISDKVTVQSAIQQNADGDTEIMVGGQMSLGTKWAMAVDSAVRGSALGLVSELQGNGDRWDFNLRLTAKEEGYSTDTSPDTHDVRLRTFLKLSTKLSVGLIGRAAKVESGEKTEFLLPAGYLNLASSLSLSAVPNQDGNYRLSAGYRLTDNTQLTSIYEEDLLSAQLLYKWSDYRDFDFNYLYNEDTDEYTLSGRLNWYPYGTHNERWQTGVSYNGSSTGYQLSWNKIFKPGIELRVDYLDGYNALSDIENERRLFVSLKTDFSRVGGKFVPSNND
ncbi:MAG: hypothetical protein OQL16_00145, partial [Gammaproteobacteria bacterium]|nr:hypothetical protein [Gammaproteobacteria bacterium]